MEKRRDAALFSFRCDLSDVVNRPNWVMEGSAAAALRSPYLIKVAGFQVR
jgi:hypothetical protein